MDSCHASGAPSWVASEAAGRETAGNQQAVRGQLPLAALARDDLYAAQRGAPAHRRDASAAQHVHPELARALRRTRGGAHVGDTCGADASGGERKQRFVSLVVIHKEYRAAPDRHAVAPQVGQRSTGEHHSRDVVTGEGDQPLVRSRGQEHTLRADHMQPLAQPAERGTLGRAEYLERCEYAVPVGAQHRGPLEAAHAAHPDEPGAAALAPDPPARIEQRAAPEGGVLFGQQHPQPTGAKHRCGGEPRGSGTDDEHIGMPVHRFRSFRVCADDRREHPESRRAADEWLVQTLPGPPGRHECLVVEARGQKT